MCQSVFTLFCVKNIFHLTLFLDWENSKIQNGQAFNLKRKYVTVPKTSLVVTDNGFSGFLDIY